MTSDRNRRFHFRQDNAVDSYRKLIGATDPRLQMHGTIRKNLLLISRNNSVHGSDSDENANKEILIIFGQ